MSPLFPRSASSLLSRVLVWGLVLVMLRVQQPNYPGTKLTELWLTQLAVLFLLVGLFYVTLHWAVLRLLFRRRWFFYLLFLALAGADVPVVHQQTAMWLHAPELVARGREAVMASLNPWSSPHQHFVLGSEAEGGELVNPWGLLLVLLVLPVSASLATLHKSPHDAESRLELERRQVAIELSLLKAQINPHFFFNTLNNIYALTLLDGERARVALHRLSRMMRYVLYETPGGNTRLSQEVSFLRDYIDLMHLRLTDQVEVVLRTPLDPASHDPFIAPMLFQPYVENAFKHGISALAPSRITIELCQPAPDRVQMCVRNTLFATSSADTDEPGGIGLANTQRRLDLLYPGRHELRVTVPTLHHEYEVCLSLHLLP